MTSEQLEQLAQLVANKILAELTKPPENVTFHKEIDMFGNVKYFNRKEILALQLSQLDEQREKLLAEEKYELLIELEEIYNKIKKEHDNL